MGTCNFVSYFQHLHLEKLEREHSSAPVELPCVQPAWEDVNPEGQSMTIFENAASCVPQSFFFLHHEAAIDSELRKRFSERAAIRSTLVLRRLQVSRRARVRIYGLRPISKMAWKRRFLRA